MGFQSRLKALKRLKVPHKVAKQFLEGEGKQDTLSDVGFTILCRELEAAEKARIRKAAARDSRRSSRFSYDAWRFGRNMQLTAEISARTNR